MRVTRAALRAQVHEEPQLVFEDADADSFHTSPDVDANSDLSRPPLKDITEDANPPTTDDPFEDEQSAPVKKVQGKKAGRKGKKDTAEEELLQGEQGVQQDPTTEEQNCTTQIQSSDETLDSQTVSFGASLQEINYEESLTPAPLDSTSTPQQSQTGPPKTPKFDPSIHKLEEGVATPIADTSEDSFVEKITSRTPGRMLSFQDENKSPDLFVEHVNSRTPRIEDSVEAIDALEDAIETVAKNLPDLEQLTIDSPVKSRKITPARVNLSSKAPKSTSSKKPVPSPARTQRLSPAKTRPAVKAPERPKTTAPRPSTVKPAAKPITSAKPAKKPITAGPKLRQPSTESAAPPLSFSNSPAKNLPNTTQKRVPSATLSTSRPAFVPARSSKPPTKSTFQLPGEAISAKVKAQREERLRREEEAEKERKMFKARPMPTKVVRPSVVPRENKASQARLSIYANGVNKENVAPKPTIAPPPKVRPSSLDTKPKASEKSTAKANSSVRRTTSVTAVVSRAPRVSSLNLTTGQKTSVTKEDAVQQKHKGKEVFGRTKAELERAEKERREKEEATKKARAEAAERGRQASREWAEKQKKKIAAQAQAKGLGAKQTENGAVAAAS